MGVYFLSGMGFLLLANFIFEWRIRSRTSIREKRVFVIIWSLAWLVVLLVSEFPQRTTPRQWIDFIYKPLLLWLKHPS
ncbi:hypothetical protein ABN764_12795 [Paenibacillaceae sp. P-4]|uniref:hypothetical protein n=1 Tax=Paenibacillaceae bacterium P-4 TaxID=3160969 RepID=UPI0032E8400F